jgi:hypothetical protein
MVFQIGEQGFQRSSPRLGSRKSQRDDYRIDSRAASNFPFFSAIERKNA